MKINKFLKTLKNVDSKYKIDMLNSTKIKNDCKLVAINEETNDKRVVEYQNKNVLEMIELLKNLKSVEGLDTLQVEYNASSKYNVLANINTTVEFDENKIYIFEEANYDVL